MKVFPQIKKIDPIKLLNFVRDNNFSHELKE